MDFAGIELEDDTTSMAEGGDNDQEDDASLVPIVTDPQGQDLRGKPQTGLVEGPTTSSSPEVIVTSPPKATHHDGSPKKA